MERRYIDDIEVRAGTVLVRTIHRRPLRALPNGNHGVTFRRAVYELRNRQIDISQPSWRTADCPLAPDGEACPPPAATPAPSNQDDGLVGVGDRVGYRRFEGAERSVLISEGQSVPVAGIVNKETAIAKALIGCELGEMSIVTVEGEQPFVVWITSIEKAAK